MADAATDHGRLADLHRDLLKTERRRTALEEEWLTLAT